MNHRPPSPIPPRRSASTYERHTTQEYLATHQTTAPTDEWENDEQETYPHRLPTSARRYTVQDQHPERQLTTVQRQRKQKHPLLYMGLGMLVALALVTLLLGPGVSWWTDWRNYTTYGDPRTFQTDAVVGHNDSASHPSHFIALNLHGQIIVIEFPGGDPSRGRDFLITTIAGPDADRVPVTLSFRDVNGGGEPDMLIQFHGQQIVYLNDHGTFRPARPGETINING